MLENARTYGQYTSQQRIKKNHIPIFFSEFSHSYYFHCLRNKKTNNLRSYQYTHGGSIITSIYVPFTIKFVNFPSCLLEPQVGVGVYVLSTLPFFKEVTTVYRLLPPG
jgi:dipeptidase